MATLTVTIDGGAETPVLEGSDIRLEQQEPGATLKLYQESPFSSIGDRDDVLVKEGSTNKFHGEVVNVQYEPGQMGPGGRFVVVECVGLARNWKAPPDRISKHYPAQSDQTTVIDLVSEAGYSGTITATTATVKQTDASLEVTIPPLASLREALDEVERATGGKDFLDADDTLHYGANSDFPAAAWDVDTDSPGVGEYDVEELSYETDSLNLANKVTVMGGIPEGGLLPLMATVSDSTSITAYGQRHTVIESSDLVVQAHVDAVAAAALAELKDPIARATFKKLDDDGADLLEPGTKIQITSNRYGLTSKELVIQAVALEQESATLTRMSVECGERRPSHRALVERLAGVRRRGSTHTSVQLHGLEFDGSESLDNSTVPSSFDVGISAWFYLNTAGITQQIATTNGGWTLEITSGDEVRFNRNFVTTDAEAVSNNANLATGRWYHVAASHDRSGNAPELYLNGVELTYGTSTADSGAVSSHGSQIDIGTNFEGAISRFVVFDNWLWADIVAKVSSLSWEIGGFPLHNVLAGLMLDDAADGATVSGAGTIANTGSVGGAYDANGTPTGRKLVYVPQ